MYFLLADLIHRFNYLNIGLAAILIWVGVKTAFATRGQGRRAVEPTGAEMFRDATPDEVASLSPVVGRRPR